MWEITQVSVPPPSNPPPPLPPEVVPEVSTLSQPLLQPVLDQAPMRKLVGYVTVFYFAENIGGIRDLGFIDSEPWDVLNLAVERAARGWKFEPGEKQGRL